jgi:hypothetical protein
MQALTSQLTADSAGDAKLVARPTTNAVDSKVNDTRRDMNTLPKNKLEAALINKRRQAKSMDGLKRERRSLSALS